MGLFDKDRSGFGGGFMGGMGGGDGFEAMDMSSPGACVKLAMMVLRTNKTNHFAAVELSRQIREVTISLITAVALVSQLQDPDNPIVLDLDTHLGNAEETKYNPGELLESLAQGFPNIQEHWDNLVEIFTESYNRAVAEAEIAEIPDTLTVEDILGGK
jgi:hypothetical protein